MKNLQDGEKVTKLNLGYDNIDISSFKLLINALKNNEVVTVNLTTIFRIKSPILSTTFKNPEIIKIDPSTIKLFKSLSKHG